MTSLACLAQMGLSMPERERTILLHMCHLWRDRPSARPLIMLIYRQLSDCLQYHLNAPRSSSFSSSSTTIAHVQTSQMRLRSSSLFPLTSTASLLDDHLDHVLCEWLVKGHSIGDFPRELLMFNPSSDLHAFALQGATSPSLESFLKQFANRIAPILVLHHDTMQTTMKLLLDTLGVDLAALLKKHFSVCCARFYAIYAQRVDDTAMTQSFLGAATSCLDFLKTAMQERKFNTYYHSRLNDMLCALIDLVVIDPSEPRLAQYSLSNLTLSLTQIAKADKLDIPHHLCSPQHDRIQSLLLYLRVRIAAEFRAFRQWKLVEIARTLILEHTGEFLSVPSVWRPVLDFLLWMLPEFDQRFPTHALQCSTTLAEVATKLIQQVTTGAGAAIELRRTRAGRSQEADGAADASSSSAVAVPTRMPQSEMMLHIRHIITAMVEYSEAGTHLAVAVEEEKLDAEPKDAAATKVSHVAALLMGIIRSIPISLHPELTLLPPFPVHPGFAELRAFQKSIQYERNLAEEILAFLITVRSSSNPSEGAAGLAHLLAQLRGRSAELIRLLQPIPPSLASLGMELLFLPAANGSPARRASLGSRSIVANAIISVDGRNAQSSSDVIDVVSDISNSVRVSNRILSSPDYESSGHWAFDLIAPLIGALCAFCSWSQTDGDAARSPSERASSHRIHMLAVRCLGEIGAIDPHALNGHNARIFRNANPLPPVASSKSIIPDTVHPFASALLGPTPSAAAATAQLQASWYGRWYAIGGGLQTSSFGNKEMRAEPSAYANDPHHLLVLYLLNQYWRSSNVHVAQMSYHTLLNLFCTIDASDNSHPSSQAQAAAALARLDGLTQAYLTPFMITKFKTFRPVLKARSKSDDLENDAWELNGRTPDDWICKVARFLLNKRVADPVLQHCAGLASHLPDFAARLFPFALYDVLQQADAEMSRVLALRLNALILSINESVASPLGGSSAQIASTAHVGVLSYILAGLQYVREQCLILHRQPIPPPPSRHQPVQQRANMPVAQSIEQNFDAHVNLLAVAEAAQTCGMFASSLLYLEAWHVRTYGRINSTSAESEEEFRKSLAKNAQTRATSTPSPAANGLTPSSAFVAGPATSVPAAVPEDPNAKYHRLLIEVYRNVSDVDGIYGALHSRELLDDATAELIISEHEGKYDETMQVYDSMFQQAHKRSNGGISAAPAVGVAGRHPDCSSSVPVETHAGLVRSLQRLGCSHLVDRYMSDLSGNDPMAYGSISDAHYEAAWRTANWDLPTQSLPTVPSAAALGGNVESGLHTSLFSGLRALHGLASHHKNLSSFEGSVTAARARLVQELARAHPETAQRVFPAIVHLQLLADMEKAWSIIDQPMRAEDAMDMSDSGAPSSALDISPRFAQFERFGRDRLFLLFNDFDMVEPILALHGVILEIAKQPSVLASHLRFAAAFARQSDRRVVGAQAIRTGAADPAIPLVNKLALKLEGAQLNWAEGLVDPAIRSAKLVVQAMQSVATQAGPPMESQATVKLLVDSSCLLAEWMSTSHSETSTIIQRYLLEAADVVTKSRTDERFTAQQQHRCFYQLGCLMDRVFQSIYNKTQTPEHEASRALFRSNEEKIRKLKESMDAPQIQLILRTRDSTDEKLLAAKAVYSSKQMYIRRLEKEHQVDALQIQQLDQSLSKALEQAILNYAECLKHGDRYDTQVVYRLIALWFNHYATATFTAEKLHVVSKLDSIPTRKFIPLVYQIASVSARSHIKKSLSLPSLVRSHISLLFLIHSD